MILGVEIMGEGLFSQMAPTVLRILYAWVSTDCFWKKEQNRNKYKPLLTQL